LDSELEAVKEATALFFDKGKDTEECTDSMSLVTVLEDLFVAD
jgi:hypothetical protein